MRKGAEEKDFKLETRMDDANGWLGQPSAHVEDGLMNVQRLSEYLPMGHKPDESADAEPRQTHRSPAFERGFPPSPRLGMCRGLVVVGIDEQVDVRDDHGESGWRRWNSPAFSSSAKWFASFPVVHGLLSSSPQLGQPAADHVIGRIRSQWITALTDKGAWKKEWNDEATPS